MLIASHAEGLLLIFRAHRYQIRPWVPCSGLHGAQPCPLESVSSEFPACAVVYTARLGNDFELTMIGRPGPSGVKEAPGQVVMYASSLQRSPGNMRLTDNA